MLSELSLEHLTVWWHKIDGVTCKYVRRCFIHPTWLLMVMDNKSGKRSNMDQVALLVPRGNDITLERGVCELGTSQECHRELDAQNAQRATGGKGILASSLVS